MYCCACCKHFRDTEKEGIDGYCNIFETDVRLEDVCDAFKVQGKKKVKRGGKMTKREWLMSLSDEELADWLADRLSCGMCDLQDTCGHDKRSFEVCRETMKNWLEEEHKNPKPALEKGDVIKLKGDPLVYVYIGEDMAVMAGSDTQRLIYNINAVQIEGIKRYEISQGKHTCIWRDDDGV